MLNIMKQEREYWLDIFESTKNRLLKRVSAVNLHKINSLICKWYKIKNKKRRL